MAQGFSYAGMRDYDAEAARTRVRTAVITALNWDAQATLRGAWESSIIAMSEVTTLANIAYGNEQVNNRDKASSTYAQRELKWLVQYTDDVTGLPGKFYIPCAKTTLLDPNDRAHAHIGDGGVVDNFVSQVEAFVLSDAGNAVTVTEITLVGRNV